MRLLSILLIMTSLSTFGQQIQGGWKHQDGDKTTLILATESYISITEYKSAEFIKTWGGKYTIEKNGPIYIDMEFNSADASTVPTRQTYNLKTKRKTITFNNQKFDRVDAKATNALTGLWVITGRANPEGEMGTLTPGDRRTYKMNADGYFQWLAINIKTGQFSGTGGGKYTLENGKYTEHIEFFSRDNSRVGAKLGFDASVTETEWTHSGLSSTGNPIKEIWTKVGKGGFEE